MALSGILKKLGILDVLKSGISRNWEILCNRSIGYVGWNGVQEIRLGGAWVA